MADLFSPEISHVIGGMEGKSIVIYGPNRAGKTYNTSLAPKPLFLSFEKGLNAIEGVAHFYIDKWGTFTNLVQQLTSPATIAKAKERYSTIIIDTIQGITDLADDYICDVFGIGSIAAGNRGFGNWKEYEKEMLKPIKKLCSAGYTVVFLAHEVERKLKNEVGEEFNQLYPKSGDLKRCSAIICDFCDIIAYAQTQNSADGNEILSTLHLKGTQAFYAGSRFRKIVSAIPEWNWEKLVKAIDDAIKLEEQATGVKATTFQKKKEEEAKQQVAVEKDENKNIETLVAELGEMLAAMNQAEGNVETFNKMKEACNAQNFKAKAVNENSSPEEKARLQYFYDQLVDKGYYEKAGLGKKQEESK